MELVTTPKSNIEVDLHGSYSFDPVFHQDIRFLRAESSSRNLSNQEAKLYRHLTLSLIFSMARGNTKR